ncbi:MAG TPA: ABC transporter substrate-binding protein [Casimicrobiaceae bacterium]
MDRRRFVARLAATAWVAPSLARAQAAPLPVVGFLRTTSSAGFSHVVAALREGLGDTGYVEGRNVVIDYRWADDRLERLPALADALIARRVAVIVCNSQAATALKAKTSSVPIVFVTADDPVRRGLVATLARPGANVTGVTFFGGGLLGGKRYELLRELVPKATVVGFLLDTSFPTSEDERADAQTAASARGNRLVVARVQGPQGLAAAFDGLVKDGAAAVIVAGSPGFTGARRELVALAARHRLPAIYDQRDYVEAGGMMSYGGSLAGAYREAGEYAGRILKGAKPADLPVKQPTTFGLVVNVATLRSLKLELPSSLRLRAEALVE